MKRAIKDGKAGIVEQFRQLAWQSKHPFATVNYEAWLERKQAKAVRLMKQAAKDGRPDVVEQYRQWCRTSTTSWTACPAMPLASVTPRWRSSRQSALPSPTS